MVSIKFAPLSKETQIPGTNCSIQVGVIQNNGRSWGVKLIQDGKIIAAKRIKKLIDVEIVGVIRDTIGKLFALDTFELGSVMSSLLREVYDKLKSTQKPAEPQVEAPQQTSIPATQPSIPSQSTQQEDSQIDHALLEMHVPKNIPAAQASNDDFWSAYSDVDSSSTEVSEPIYETNIPQAPASSSKLEDALAVLGINCPNCGKEVDSDAEKCDYCGQPL
ncbi:MAG TPA: zinc ribbon domain-containing protein [Candidatus Deferrimicrobium sp.]|nr:zinc ribbon domain-containing protein [Candidatus Deferrimicrobium sp.]